MSSALKRLYVIIGVTVGCLVMGFIDAVVMPGYLVKSFIKILLFLGIPLIYFLVNREERSLVKSMFIPRKKSLLLSIFMGIAVFSVILIAYFILRQSIDFTGISDSLTSSAGVDGSNFIFVAVYISLINSLLEELFFRGFAFLILKKRTSRMISYVFSSSAFALYHVGMTLGWFNHGIFALAFAGLYAGGCVFNAFNEKSGNIYSSWIIHMFANFAINTVGMIMFYST